MKCQFLEALSLGSVAYPFVEFHSVQMIMKLFLSSQFEKSEIQKVESVRTEN